MRYVDGKEWKQSFDSVGAGALPVAVEVAVWFGAPKADPGAAKPATRGGAVEKSEDDGAARQETDAATVPSREPDRLRVIVVPDGPVASWKESR